MTQENEAKEIGMTQKEIELLDKAMMGFLGSDDRLVVIRIIDALGFRKSPSAGLDEQALNTELTLHTPLMAHERQLVINCVMSTFAIPSVTEEELRKLIIDNSSAKGFDTPVNYKVTINVCDLARAILERLKGK